MFVLDPADPVDDLLLVEVLPLSAGLFEPNEDPNPKLGRTPPVDAGLLNPDPVLLELDPDWGKVELDEPVPVDPGLLNPNPEFTLEPDPVLPKPWEAELEEELEPPPLNVFHPDWLGVPGRGLRPPEYPPNPV